MNKKIGLGVLVVIFLAMGMYAIKSGSDYYNNRYIGSDYYGKISLNQNVEYQDVYDDRGKRMDRAIDYTVMVYNEKGEKRIAQFSRYEGQTIYEPGSYIKVNLSKQIVLKQEGIDFDAIPIAVKECLK